MLRAFLDKHLANGPLRETDRLDPMASFGLRARHIKDADHISMAHEHVHAEVEDL